MPYVGTGFSNVPTFSLTPAIGAFGKEESWKEVTQKRCGKCGLTTCCICYSIADAICCCRADTCEAGYDSLKLVVVGLLTLGICLYIILMSTILGTYDISSKFAASPSHSFTFTIGLSDFRFRHRTETDGNVNNGPRIQQFDNFVQFEQDQILPDVSYYLPSTTTASPISSNNKLINDSSKTFFSPALQKNLTSLCSGYENVLINSDRNNFINEKSFGNNQTLSLCQFQFSRLASAIDKQLYYSPPFITHKVTVVNNQTVNQSASSSSISPFLSTDSLDFWRQTYYNSLRPFLCQERLETMSSSLKSLSATRIPRVIFVVLFMLYGFIGALDVDASCGVCETCCPSDATDLYSRNSFFGFLIRSHVSFMHIAPLIVFTIAFVIMSSFDIDAVVKLYSVANSRDRYCGEDPLSSSYFPLPNYVWSDESFWTPKDAVRMTAPSSSPVGIPTTTSPPAATARATRSRTVSLLDATQNNNISTTTSSSTMIHQNTTVAPPEPTSTYRSSTGFTGSWADDVTATPIITNLLSIVICLIWFGLFAAKYWSANKHRYYAWRDRRDKKAIDEEKEEKEEMERRKKYGSSGKAPSAEELRLEKVRELEEKLKALEDERKADIRRHTPRGRSPDVPTPARRTGGTGLEGPVIAVPIRTMGGGGGGDDEHPVTKRLLAGTADDDLDFLLKKADDAAIIAAEDKRKREAEVIRIREEVRKREEAKKKKAPAGAAFPSVDDYFGLSSSPGGGPSVGKKTTFSYDDDDDTRIVMPAATPFGGDTRIFMPAATPFGGEPAVMISSPSSASKKPDSWSKKPSAKGGASSKLSGGSSTSATSAPKSGSSGKSIDSLTKML